MLLAYFDESGEHNRDSGNLSRLTVGGLLTTLENWQRISAEWNKVLETKSVTTFHMTDFEAYEGEFHGWSKGRHERLVERLLTILIKEPITIIGVSMVADGTRKRFRRTYAKCVVQAINGACMSGRLNYGQQPLSLVFAKTNDFSYRRIAAWCDKISLALPSLTSCTGTDPESCPPLQAADLVAYELARLERGQNRYRYPFHRMSRGPVSFNIRNLSKEAVVA